MLPTYKDKTMQTNTPQIRFKGFTEPWEIRKCKELCDITTGKSNTQDQSANGIYPFFIRSDTPAKSNRYLYDDEAVITIGDGNIGRVFHYINGKYDLHQRCYKMSNFRELIAKYFYYYFSANFYKRAMTMTAKATVDSVRLDMIAEMDIMYPNSKKEQQKIGELFGNFDNLINLYGRKCESLKKIKKAMLYKMFPQNGESAPQIRFKGFTEPWQWCKVEDCMKTITDYVAAGSFADIAANVEYKNSPDYAQLVRTVDLKHKF